MAAKIPAVLVYQENATLATTVSNPELNVCVVGPAYQLMDYPEDAALQTATVYGSATTTTLGGVGVQAAAPAAATLTVGGITTGAVVDTTSYVVTLIAPTVEITSGTCTNVINTATLTVGSDPIAAGVVVGDTIWVDVSAGGSALKNTVRSLTTTTIVLNNQLADTTHVKYRVERVISPVHATPSATTATTVTLPASLTVLLNGVAKTVVTSQVFIGFKALRQDLAQLQSFGSTASILAGLGKFDARNPLCVGTYVAKLNTASSVQAYGITTNDDSGYATALARLSSRNDLYSLVPLTQSITTLAAYKQNFENVADPDYAVTNGVAQRFRIVIGNPLPLPTTSIIVDRNIDGGVANTVAATPARLPLAFGAFTDSFVTLGILPGYKLNYTISGTAYTYTVSSVINATTLMVDESSPTLGSTTAISFTTPAGATITPSDVIATLTTAAAVKPYTELSDANGTFVDAGVMAGDYVEMPADPTSTVFTGALIRVKIASIESNQHLTCVDNGPDTSLVTNELLHGYSRVLVGGSLSGPIAATNLTYRITRTLTTDQQADALIASGPGSLASRRAVAVWPDLVDVAGLKDASLTRTSVSSTTLPDAASQPGYYLAAAVGGFIAGVPSHQGLTRQSLTGITKLYNSNTYFSAEQLAKISNNGWFLLQQDVPTALPYVVHALTTDVSTLQFGELMMVKNLDYVSTVYADALNPFIGKWNINDETLGFVAAAVATTSNTLRLDRRAKIGSRINSAKITNLAPNVDQPDRLELKLEVDFPKPLNTVAIHIVSL